LEAEGERTARIVGKPVRRVQRKRAVLAALGDIKLKLDRDDRSAARASETLDLIGEHGARVDIFLAVDCHHDLRVLAVPGRKRRKRAAQEMTLKVGIARLPQ